MLFKIEPGDVREDVSDDLVGEGLLVKNTH